MAGGTTNRSPRGYWKAMRREREDACRPGDDGPIIKSLKTLLGLGLWHRPVEEFARRRIAAGRRRDPRYREKDGRSEFNKSIELYWILWTVGLLAAYGLAVWSGSWTCTAGRDAVLVLVALVAFYRSVEIVAASFRLHVFMPYETESLPHALVLTFLAYVHEILSFGVLYLFDSCRLGDGFHAGRPLWKGVGDAAYFSAVTMTTLGYGDYFPERWLGKLLVVCEVFVGLLLVLVAFQRVLASNPKWSAPERSHQARDPRDGSR